VAADTVVESGEADVADATETDGTADDAADADEEMLVLFVPLAPNPVMGGFMVCVPRERAMDVDMTVQEAFQAIVTSGVALTDPPEGAADAGAGAA
jgi:uncharacterized membrane protein